MKDLESIINQKVYERLIEKKAPTREEDLELWKSMLRTICKTDDEDEIKRLLNNLKPYLKNKLRPFLFMIGEKDKLRSETTIAISQIFSKTSSPLAPRTLEVSVSVDIM